MTDSQLTLNIQKYTIYQISIKFLGNMISKSGILLDTAHIETTVDASAPNDWPSLHLFIRLILWYRKCIPSSATDVEPMHALVRKTTEAKFGLQKQKKNFKTKKQCWFNPSLLTTVSTDKPDYRLMWVLTQHHADSVEHTVPFALHILMRLKKNTPQLKKRP